MLSHFRAPSWRFCVQLPVIYLKLTKANNRDRFTSGFWMFPNGVQIFCYFPFWYAVTCCWVTIAGLLASCGIFVLLLGISGTSSPRSFLKLDGSASKLRPYENWYPLPFVLSAASFYCKHQLNSAIFVEFFRPFLSSGFHDWSLEAFCFPSQLVFINAPEYLFTSFDSSF